MDKWLQDIPDDEIHKLLQAGQTEEGIEQLFQEELSIETPPNSVKENLFQRIEAYNTSHVRTSFFGSVITAIKNIFSVPSFRFALSGVAALAVLVISLFSVVTVRGSHSIEVAQATITGDVSLIRSNKRLVIEEEQTLKQGDVIRTGAESSYSVFFGDQYSRKITLKENTSITLPKVPGIGNATTKIALDTGRSLYEIDWVQSNERFIVDTYLASVEIHGTKFLVASDDTHVQVAVVEGIVEVTPQDTHIKPFLIKAGDMAFIYPDSDTPDIQPVTDEIEREFGIQSSTSPHETQEEPVKEWVTKKLFSFNYADKPVKNRVLGFTSHGNYAAGISEAEVIWWNTDTNSYKRTVYGELQGMYFKSLPRFESNTVIAVSINKKLLVKNVKSGTDTISDIDGFLSYGYSMIEDAGRILVPLDTGIYTLDTKSLSLSSTPVIPFQAATTPLIVKDRVYVSSYLNTEDNVACFDSTGKEIWKYSTSQPVFSPVAVLNNTLIVCDAGGTLYRLSRDGTLENKVLLSDGVTARMEASNGHLYVLSDNGWLYSYDTLLKETRLFQVDAKPDKSLYLFKSPAIYNGTLFIGTDYGTVIVYDIKSKEKTDVRLPVKSSVISTRVSKSGTSYLVGDTSGSVYSLRLE
jgi:uncharacterized membrane protein YkoI